MGKAQIGFILGTPFCGSTVFARALATQPDTFDLGEVDRLSVMGENGFRLDADHACETCTAQGQVCPALDPDLLSELRQTDRPAALYDLVERHSGARTIIDGSKHAYWFRKMMTDPAVANRARAILLVRHPAPFMFRFARANAQLDPFAALLLGAETWRSTYMDLLRSLFSFQTRFIILRLDHFRGDPDGVARYAAGFLGTDCQMTGGRLSNASTHTIGGNPDLAARTSLQDTTTIDGEAFDITPEQRAAMQFTPGLSDLAVNVFGFQLG